MTNDFRRSGGITAPRLSEKEALVLRLFVSKPGKWYGLELVAASNDELKKGTVYVTLGRMVEKGYLTSEREQLPEESPVAIPRRLYKMTGLGQQTYAAHLAAQHAFQMPAGVSPA